jgi:magnesium-transporting ATPase (P-type)
LVIFARVSPHQKQKIVRVLQEKGEIVAMTGDGVNDAPALKKADIGIAVANACEVAKEAADLILLDNNFKTIVDACYEGRLVFYNIKKTIGYMLSNSFEEIVLILGAFLWGLPAPLTIVQILWIELICDGPPDLMQAFEPAEPEFMHDTPQATQKRNFRYFYQGVNYFGQLACRYTVFGIILVLWNL